MKLIMKLLRWIFPNSHRSPACREDGWKLDIPYILKWRHKFSHWSAFRVLSKKYPYFWSLASALILTGNFLLAAMNQKYFFPLSWIVPLKLCLLGSLVHFQRKDCLLPFFGMKDLVQEPRCGDFSSWLLYKCPYFVCSSGKKLVFRLRHLQE